MKRATKKPKDEIKAAALRDAAARERVRQLTEAAEASGIEVGPSLVGALTGLSDEIRAWRLSVERETGEQRLATLQLIAEIDEERRERRLLTTQQIDAIRAMTVTCQALTDELAAQRTQRARNGHPSSTNRKPTEE